MNKKKGPEIKMRVAQVQVKTKLNMRERERERERERGQSKSNHDHTCMYILRVSSVQVLVDLFYTRYLTAIMIKNLL